MYLFTSFRWCVCMWYLRFLKNVNFSVYRLWHDSSNNKIMMMVQNENWNAQCVAVCSIHNWLLESDKRQEKTYTIWRKKKKQKQKRQWDSVSNLWMQQKKNKKEKKTKCPNYRFFDHFLHSQIMRCKMTAKTIDELTASKINAPVISGLMFHAAKLQSHSHACIDTLYTPSGIEFDLNVLIARRKMRNEKTQRNEKKKKKRNAKWITKKY